MLKKSLFYLMIALTLFACQKEAVVKDSPTAGATELSGIIGNDMTIGGVIRVISDVYVKEGVTLTIEPGSKLIMVKSESTKVEPLFLSSNTEILVKGSIIAKGNANSNRKISFVPEKKGKDMKDFAGIIFLKGSDSVFENCYFESAEAAIFAIDTDVTVKNCVFDSCFYALVAKRSGVRFSGGIVRDCDKGVYYHNSTGEVKDSAFSGSLEDALFISSKSVISVSNNIFKNNLIAISTIEYKAKFLENNSFENNKEDVRALNYW